MSKIRVGVLRGGPTNFESSLESGSFVLKNLPEKYLGHDIFVDKEGAWHFEGLPITPQDLSKKVDVVWNALHGTDSKEQRAEKRLELFGIPFTGASALSASLLANRSLTKKVFATQGFKTPHFKLISNEGDVPQKILEIFRTFPMPVVVKPVVSSVKEAISFVSSFAQLCEAIEKAFLYADTAVVEEFIAGKEALCIVSDNFRGEKNYSFLPIEKRKNPDGEFDAVSPGNFSKEEKVSLQELAKKAHELLNLRHYSHSHFVVNPRRGIYILETNTVPELFENSPLHKSLHDVGSSFSHFLDHILSQALNR